MPLFLRPPLKEYTRVVIRYKKIIDDLGRKKAIP